MFGPWTFVLGIIIVVAFSFTTTSAEQITEEELQNLDSQMSDMVIDTPANRSLTPEEGNTRNTHAIVVQKCYLFVLWKEQYIHMPVEERVNSTKVAMITGIMHKICE